MTERKPPEISFASWIDQQINEAAERGAFDNLPGAGKPLPKRGAVDDGQAWLRDKLRREGVSAEEILPTPLRLRKEVERLTATVQDLRSEQDVREVVAGLNQRIVQWRRIPEGPAGIPGFPDREEPLGLEEATGGRLAPAGPILAARVRPAPAPRAQAQVLAGPAPSTWPRSCSDMAARDSVTKAP